MNCPHAASGCNYPEAHCLGLCDQARSACADRGVVLTIPAGIQADPARLRNEFGARAIHYNRHPSHDVLPGVLHLTCMHPEDLRSAGCTDFMARGWPAGTACHAAQRGVVLPRASVLVAVLTIFVATCSAFIGPALDDIDAARAAAQDRQTTQNALQRRARMEAVAQAMCGGENAVATWLADGSVQCRNKRGQRTQRITVAEVRR